MAHVSTVGQGTAEAGSEAPTVPFTFLESARRIGVYVWTETFLYEMLGAWAVSTSEPSLKVYLSTRSSHHAWHAQLWRERLPELREFDVDGFVAPANDEIASLLKETEGIGATRQESVNGSPDRNGAGPGASVLRMTVLHRVLLPHLEAAYRHHFHCSSVVCDTPVIRTLRLVMSDMADDSAEGEFLLEEFMVDGADADAANESSKLSERFESRFAEAGGIVGLRGTG